MPGIIGCFTNQGREEEVIKGKELLVGDATLVQDPLFFDEHIICTRVHLGVIGENTSPKTTSRKKCWLEGEFYNTNYLKNKFNLKESTEANLVLEAANKNILKAFLGAVDGFFCGVLYDKEKESLIFITDRFGLKPLYILRKAGDIVGWSSEIKGFLYFKKFDKRIESRHVMNFLKSGYYLNNTTPFSQIHLLGPSSMLTVNYKEQQKISSKKYWQWPAVQQLDISFEATTKQFSHLLETAIHSRMSTPEKVNVSLSGGLDSRVILAAAKIKNKDIKTFTFGIQKSYEQRIAQKVAQTAEVENHCFNLNDTNWFKKRIEGIWKTDGLLSLVHMHGSVHHQQLGKLDPICLHGIGGGILLGGRQLVDPKEAISQSAYGTLPSEIKTQNLFFHSSQQTLPHLIHNRLRRFTLQGMLEQKYAEYRAPFFNNELISFLYSINKNHLADYKLYKAGLLYKYPYLFEKIPYSNLSYPISNKGKILFKIKRKLHYLAYRYGFTSAYHITEYSKWIKSINQSIFQMLKSENALYKNYVPESYIQKIDDNDYIKVGKLLTLEIYLQQVFNRDYLTTEKFNRG